MRSNTINNSFRKLYSTTRSLKTPSPQEMEHSVIMSMAQTRKSLQVLAWYRVAASSETNIIRERRGNPRGLKMCCTHRSRHLPAITFFCRVMGLKRTNEFNHKSQTRSWYLITNSASPPQVFLNQLGSSVILILSGGRF